MHLLRVYDVLVKVRNIKQPILIHQSIPVSSRRSE